MFDVEADWAEPIDYLYYEFEVEIVVSDALTGLESRWQSRVKTHLNRLRDALTGKLGRLPVWRACFLPCTCAGESQQWSKVEHRCGGGIPNRPSLLLHSRVERPSFTVLGLQSFRNLEGLYMLWPKHWLMQEWFICTSFFKWYTDEKTQCCLKQAEIQPRFF